MNQTIMTKPAVKRGGAAYWAILLLFRFFFPAMFFVILPICCIAGNFPLYALTIPAVGLICCIFIIKRSHTKIMKMSLNEYNEKFKIIITKPGSSNTPIHMDNSNVNHDIHTQDIFNDTNHDNKFFNPATNINDAITSGQYFIDGSPGSVFNPNIHNH